MVLYQCTKVFIKILEPVSYTHLDLVTESFTLIAGTGNVPLAILSYNLCTPVVDVYKRQALPDGKETTGLWPGSMPDQCAG